MIEKKFEILFRDFTRDVCAKKSYTPPMFHAFMPQVQLIQPSYFKSAEPAE